MKKTKDAQSWFLASSANQKGSPRGSLPRSSRAHNVNILQGKWDVSFYISPRSDLGRLCLGTKICSSDGKQPPCSRICLVWLTNARVEMHLHTNASKATLLPYPQTDSDKYDTREAFGPAIPISGQIQPIISRLSPKRDCSVKWVKTRITIAQSRSTAKPCCKTKRRFRM